MDIKVRYFEGAKPITAIENGDWIDLRARETVRLRKGQYHVIPLGVAMQLPFGYEAHVAPRSSTFEKWHILLVNGVGIIDNSYRGDEDEWGFPALAMEDTVIHAGDRICQFRIVPSMGFVNIREVESLGNPSRGGFGSTGER